jgi:hypothetical protein
MSVTTCKKTNPGARRYRTTGRGERMRIERKLVEARWIMERKTVDMTDKRAEPPETAYGSNCCRAGGVVGVTWVAIEYNDVESD